LTHETRYVRLALWVAYDGTSFRGFAPNVGVPTVSGALAEALKVVLGTAPPLTCAGRTDAGVHGRGQVVTFDVPEESLGRVADLQALERSINGLCRPAIVVWHVVEVPKTFDARFSAVSRSYRYSVLNRRLPDPLRRNVVWHVWDDLDMDRMQAAADHLVGTHDFSSFCRRKLVDTPEGEVEATRTRTVHSAQWLRPEGEPERSEVLRLDVRARSFCQQMVRSIVGTCVDVGRGRFEPDDVLDILARRDRRAVATVAPPQGLVLWEVGFDCTDETAVFLP